MSFKFENYVIFAGTKAEKKVSKVRKKFENYVIFAE